jgi:hypothetical protein
MAIGKSIGIVVFPALTVLGSKVVFLQALNPACGLYFEVLRNHEPGYCIVVCAQLELMQMLQCPQNGL